MTPIKNIEHQFDLRGMKVGDSFLGCDSCWFQHPVGAAAVAVCPVCRNQMSLIAVTEHDEKCGRLAPKLKLRYLDEDAQLEAGCYDPNVETIQLIGSGGAGVGKIEIHGSAFGRREIAKEILRKLG